MKLLSRIKLLYIILISSFGCSPLLTLRTGVEYSSKDGQYHLRILEDSTFELHSVISPEYYRYCEGVLHRINPQILKMQLLTFHTKNLEPEVEETNLNKPNDSIKIGVRTNIWPNELKYFSCIIKINSEEYSYDLLHDSAIYCSLKIDSIQVTLKYNDLYTSYRAKDVDFVTSTYYPKSSEFNSLSIYLPFKREYAYYELPLDSQLRLLRHSIKYGNTKLFQTQ